MGRNAKPENERVVRTQKVWARLGIVERCVWCEDQERCINLQFIEASTDLDFLVYD